MSGTTDQMANRLSSACRHGQTTYRVLAATASEVDALRETLARVADAHYILQATGASLDAFGALFALSRDIHETDTDFRSRILGARAGKLSCGTVRDLKTIINRVTGCPVGQIEILERQPGDPQASFRIRLGENTIPFSLAVLEYQVTRGKAAGVAYNINQTTIVLTPLDLALGTKPGTIMVINTGSRGGWGLSPWGTYPWGGKYLTLATGPATVTPFTG